MYEHKYIYLERVQSFERRLGGKSPFSQCPSATSQCQLRAFFSAVRNSHSCYTFSWSYVKIYLNTMCTDKLALQPVQQQCSQTATTTSANYFITLCCSEVIQTVHKTRLLSSIRHSLQVYTANNMPGIREIQESWPIFTCTDLANNPCSVVAKTIWTSSSSLRLRPCFPYVPFQAGRCSTRLLKSPPLRLSKYGRCSDYLDNQR